MSELLTASKIGETLGLSYKLDCPMFVTTSKGTGEGIVSIVDAVGSPSLILSTCDDHSFINGYEGNIIGKNLTGKLLATDSELANSIYRLHGISKVSENPDFCLGVWVSSQKRLRPYLIYCVESGLIAGDVGLNVRGAGVTMRKLDKDFDYLIDPIVSLLESKEFVGFVEIGVKKKGDDYFPVNIKTTLDSYAMPPFFELLNVSPPDFIASLFGGVETLNIKNIIGMSMCISIPPYPYYEIPVRKISIPNLIPEAMKHFWPIDIMQQDDCVHCGGVSGVLGYVTAWGNSIAEAQRRILRTIKRLSIPELQYKKDVGKKVNKFNF